MADDWDAVDQEFPSKASIVDAWDADAPDAWDAPVSNGTKKADAKTSTAKNAPSAGKSKATASDGKRGNSDKALEQARIELSKARDVADLFSSDGGQGEFELLQPAKKEEFDLLQHLILTKLSTCKSSKEFNPFIESLFRKIANELDSKTLKAINSSLTMIAKDKELAEKAVKAAAPSDSSSGARPAEAAAKAPAPAKKQAPKSRANIKVGSVYDSYGQDETYEDDDEFEDEFAYKSKAAPKPAAPAATGGYYDDEGFI